MEEGTPFLDDDEEEGDEETNVPMYRFPGDESSQSRTSSKLKSKRCICKLSFVVVCLVSLVVIFAVGLMVGHFAISYKTNSNSNSNGVNITREICSNPPLLLVSLDGFRASYFQKNATPTLRQLYLSGVKAKFMRSSFPTKTFPNHYSIVTGLYPESHGIVGNVFYDSELKDTFKFNNSTSTQSKWWGGEPIWVTAATHKLRTAIYFWPGSESVIKGKRPDIYVPYNYKNPFSLRVKTVLSWIDLPKEKRPQFMALYFNQPDHAGHSNGPDSSQVTDALSLVDLAVQLLWEGLKERNISECVNLMIVSDHGMAAYNASKFVNIANLVPSDLASNVSYVSLGAVSNLEVSGGDEVVNCVYDDLVNGTKKGLPFRVFKKDRLPLRLHTGLHNKQRYGPIYSIADVYSSMSTNDSYKPSLGDHGFDNIEKDMQAIFIGHGPAFKRTYVAEGFENIQLYSLMCDLLNITEAPNNGSYGALHGLLDPKVSAKLPPPRALETKMMGTLKECPFPRDEQELRERSICKDCVCREFCNITDDAILSSNKALFNITSAQKEMYKIYHHPWGVPVGGYGDGACILSQFSYVSLYSNTLKIPLWSAYTFDPEGVNGSGSYELGCLRRDPRVPVYQSTNCSTIFDLFNASINEDEIAPGLFLPHMDFSKNVSLSTTVLTNMIFLYTSFITVWYPALTEGWLKTSQTPLNIVMGIVLDADRDGIRDHDSTYSNKKMGLALPTHCYAVLTRCKVGRDLKSCDVQDLEVMGILLQHPLEPGDYLDIEQLLRSGLTSVRDIERVTGIDFFPNLSAKDQNTLELRLLDQLWPTTVFQ